MSNFFQNFFFHPNPKKRTKITCALCGFAVFCNIFLFQVFCRPVAYAAAICVAFLTGLLLLPFTQQKWQRMAAYLLIGAGIPICIYCIIFLADPYEHYKQYIELSLLGVFSVVLFPVALLMYLPFYLLLQIFLYIRQALNGEKLMAWLGCIIPFITFAIYLQPFSRNYHVYLQAWRQYGNTEQFAAALPRNYFIERFLGIGFKYHTKLSVIYDGWRPPLHDPYLNAALWIYSKGENGYYPPPFYMDYIIPPNNTHGLIPRVYGIESKLKYYHELFPGKPLRVDCSCNYTYDGESYSRMNFDSLAEHQ